MAITAKFAADFTDFNKGVQSAQQNLTTFQKSAELAGGRLMDIGGNADKSSARILQFNNQFQKFDSLMSAAGVNIGPIGRAITEIGTAASQSASSLGLLGSAGVAVGTAFATYNLARWALEFTGAAKGLDDQISKLVQSLTGFQAGQAEAGAKADTLARASKTAGREITSYTEAIEINRKAAAALQLQMGQSANATRDTNIALAGWQRELREVRKEGNMEALNNDLKLNMLNMEQLSAKYGLTTQALEYYKKKLVETTKEQAAQTEATKRATAEQEKLAKSVRDYYNFVGEREIQHAADVQAATEREAAALRAFYNEMGVLEMNAWKPEPVINWIEAIEEIPPAVAAAADAVRDLNQVTAQSVVAGPKPTIGGSVAGMAPTWNQNLVPKYGAGGYLGTGAPINININGSVLSDPNEIARVVGGAVTSSYRTGGNRLPV